MGHYITVTHLKIAGNIHKDYAKNEVLGEITCYLLMKLFENEINYNFVYSYCWANRITETFEIEEFESDFKNITTFFEKFTKSKILKNEYFEVTDNKKI